MADYVLNLIINVTKIQTIDFGFSTLIKRHHSHQTCSLNLTSIIRLNRLFNLFITLTNSINIVKLIFIIKDIGFIWILLIIGHFQNENENSMIIQIHKILFFFYEFSYWIYISTNMMVLKYLWAKFGLLIAKILRKDIIHFNC